MKYLQVINRYLDRGGEEIWMEEFAKFASEDSDVKDLIFESRWWNEPGAPNRLSQARLMWNNPKSRRALAEAIDLCQPDALIFHNVFPVGSFGLYDEAGKLGVPVLQYTHNFRPFSPSGTLWFGGKVQDDALKGNIWKEVIAGAWGGSRMRSALMALYLKRFRASGGLDRVSHWLAISEFMRDQFIGAGISPDKISTLRHCREISADEMAWVDDNYYLFLGRLVVEKGPHVLIKTWLKLEKELGSECPRLLIAGVGPCEEELKEMAQNSTHIQFVGFVSGNKKKELLERCRALIAPSIWWEPLGLILYDGYEYGKPVLAARSGGLEEIVVCSGSGRLHQPEDDEELAQQVIELEQLSSAERREMGRRGRIWLADHANATVWREELQVIMRRVRPTSND
ncbi:glycosyltransferase family 4 protein [bacterium]|nr:glycosyltransferase family 4 protein [bacterium]MDA8968753.1 glycosyltransferase family 4 protein [Akkermansiaceae bacterium]MDB4318220.1 glycosyltransferase family 4 protein [bacterium]MDB4388357.1 glycosyltransferase family 4 protein [Akkermansiaceae bacterium]MDB4467391.1 glycosyltransferase family 4 protein [Akkermansiaceae bacterium]